MTKVKLKDAIKDLTTDAAKVRDDASRVRQSADGLAKSLRALENGFIKSLNAKAEQEKRAEEEKRLSDHSKAYVTHALDVGAGGGGAVGPVVGHEVQLAGAHRAGIVAEIGVAVDYIGAVQGIPICFDAKESAVDTFPLQNIHEHQVKFNGSFWPFQWY